MALNAKTENTTRIALNTNTDEWWLWPPNEDAMMALNTETEKRDNDGSERQNWKCDTERWTENTMTTPNVETEKRWWLWWLRMS